MISRSAGCIVAELLLHHPLFHGARGGCRSLGARSGNDSALTRACALHTQPSRLAFFAERELLEDMVQVVGTFSESLLTDVYKMDKATTTVYATIKPKQAVEWAKRFVDMPAAGTQGAPRNALVQRVGSRAAVARGVCARVRWQRSTLCTASSSTTPASA